MNKKQIMEQLRKVVREVIQEEITHNTTIRIPVANLPLYKKGQQPTVVNPETGEEEVVSDISAWGRTVPRTPEIPTVSEDEQNFLPEPEQIDDIPSVTLHIDDDGMMKIEVSAFFHSSDNGKVPLLIKNPILQTLVMRAIQVETQKAFRRAVHGVLGIPYGLDETPHKK